MTFKVVNSIPRPALAGGKPRYDWDTPAWLARLTTRPLLAGEHIRESAGKSLRQSSRPPFVDDEGLIAVHVRNSRVEADGIRYGDVYLVWQPAGKEAQA